VSDRRDRELGLDRPITRRDFLNGVALGSAGVLLTPRVVLALDRYPPALTGLRGSHDGSFEAAHALKDGVFWDSAGSPRDTGEVYDLVVVGAGISGLAAAHFFREAAGPRSRVLILDNHDDFGGHARRNEFTLDGRVLIGYGGTFAIDSAGPWSAVAKALVRDLGVDVGRLRAVVDEALYPSLGMTRGIFFDRETFGADRLMSEPRLAWFGENEPREATAPPASATEWTAFLARAPLSEAARRDLLRLRQETVDYLPGLTSEEKKARLARMSYADFVTKIAGGHPDVLPFFQARPHSLYGVGIDAVPAQDAWAMGYPGFQGMGLEKGPAPGMNLDAIPWADPEPYFFHFPDGNATLARLLVRRLIPAAIPGRTADDIVTARADESDIVNGLESGADDYLTKPFGIPELVARIRSALRRATHSERPGTMAPFESDGLKVDYGAAEVSVKGEPVKFTATEYRLIRYLSQNAGRVLLPDQILEEVWGPEYVGDEHLVRVYISRIRKKIEDDPRNPKFIITRSGVGYLMKKAEGA